MLRVVWDRRREWRAVSVSSPGRSRLNAAQQAPAPAAEPQLAPPVPDETVQALVGRLDLERYKATIKGLTQFGDRRQGTDRNRAAVDWIQQQLESYGCPTERIKYQYVTPQRGAPRRPRRAALNRPATSGPDRAPARSSAPPPAPA